MKNFSTTRAAPIFVGQVGNLRSIGNRPAGGPRKSQQGGSASIVRGGFSTLSLCYKYGLSYYERRRPHWQPEDAALFVTWRLYGSTPKEVNIIQDLSAGQRFLLSDRELDKAATGPRWLKDERVAQCVVDALQYGETELGLYEMHAWVLMMNHVHILINPKTELQKITKSIKNFSARQANAILGRTGQPFWQMESYDRWVRGPEAMGRIVHYIGENPVTAGLVEKAEDWHWSSAFGATGSKNPAVPSPHVRYLFASAGFSRNFAGRRPIQTGQEAYRT
jgi:putative transposase